MSSRSHTSPGSGTRDSVPGAGDAWASPQRPVLEGRPHGEHGWGTPGLWWGLATPLPLPSCAAAPAPSLIPEPPCDSRSVSHPHPQRPVLNPTGSRGICRQQLPPRAGPTRLGAEGWGLACSTTGPKSPGFRPGSRLRCVLSNHPPTPCWETRRNCPACTTLGTGRSRPPSLSHPWGGADKMPFPSFAGLWPDPTHL